MFDELCAYTCPGEDYIMKNGNGIISIHSGLYTNSTTESGTYGAQTSYGAKPNPNSRYYYNLDTVTASDKNSAIFVASDSNTQSAQNKLMSWGVHTYACENLKQYFADPFEGTITSGVYDMTGYSWYPVTVNSGITVNGTFTLYNKGFEESEAIKYTTEAAADTTSGTSLAYKRTSLYDSDNSSNTQHYMMHNALFYNVESCTLALGSVTLKGNVAGYTQTTSGGGASICGALVCGTVSGSSSSKVGSVKVNTNGSISLAGIQIYNRDNVSNYAPLLINKLDNHSSIDMKNISTTEAYNYDSDNDDANDSSRIAATSLIGNAGTSVATNVNVEFSSITLDGRNDTGKADRDLSTTGNLNAMYHTFNSIFSKATLLNSLSFDSGSGRYNFTWKEDWDANSTDDVTDTTHLGKVTYGMELGYDSDNYPKTGSVSSPYYNTQYPDEEFLYFGEDPNSGKYTNPINGNDTAHNYKNSSSNLFLVNFLPYVAEKYNETNKLYQLQVNHTSAQKTGCGTYNHPYSISSAQDIIDFSDWINGSAAPTSIIIPTQNLVYGTGDDSGIITGISGTWCANQTADVACTLVGSNYEATIGSTTYTIAPTVIRKYLAGAYYKIADGTSQSDLYLGDSFQGFGKSDSDSPEYRFHGVFDGNKMTITNQSGAPFIYYSSGCVVKDLTISVEPADDIELVGFNKSFDKIYIPDNSDTGNAAYGAVISRVMGGDNIIDNVSVNYSNMKKQFLLKAKYAQLVPLGGYVGVIVGGGVIFRNMDTAASAYESAGISNSLIKVSPKTAYNTLAPAGKYTSNASTNSFLTSMAWLYVNPYIGRVINGYAITESDAYRPFENGTRVYHGGAHTDDEGNEIEEELVTEYWATLKSDSSAVPQLVSSTNYNSSDYKLQSVTLQNGNKHYSITDINMNSTLKLKVTDENEINVPDGQALFLLSIMVNSGMSYQNSATAGTSAGLLGYYKANQFVRHSTYEKIGSAADSTKDYYIDAATDSAGTSVTPYLIQNYTTPDGSNYNAKIMAAGTTVCTIHLGTYNSISETYNAGIYYLPDGYKGIGNNSVASGSTLNNSLLLYISALNGNGSRISQNSSCYYYSLKNYDTTYKFIASDTCGLGLINSNPAACVITNLILTGNVKTDVINNENGTPIAYTSGNYTATGGNKWELHSGMLIGTNTNTLTLNSVALDNVYVFGPKYAGGLIGNHPDNYKITIVNSEAGLNSDKIVVESGMIAGGLIGRKHQGELEIDYANSGGERCSLNITRVSSLCTAMTDTAKYNYGVGGIIGVCRGITATNATATRKATLKNFTMGSESQHSLNYVKSATANIYTGGLFGVLNRQYIEVENVTAHNLSVKSQLTAGGIVGHWATAGGASTDATMYASVINNTKLICNLDDAEITCTGAKNAKGEIDGDNLKYCSAGGFIGSAKEDMPQVTISNSAIEGYTISGYLNSGGFVGVWGDDSTTAANENNTTRLRDGKYDHDLILNNVSIQKCDIASDIENPIAASGGLLGKLNNAEGNPALHDYKFRLNGYNILAKSLVITGNNKGYICGKSFQSTDNSIIKLVGFSRQNDEGYSMVTDLVGDYPDKDDMSVAEKLPYGNGGYVAFADYTDQASLSPFERFSNVITSGTNVDIHKATCSTTVVTDYTVIAKRNSDGTVSVIKATGVKNTELSDETGDAAPNPRATEGNPYKYSEGTRVRWTPAVAESQVLKDGSTIAPVVLKNTLKDRGFYIKSARDDDASAKYWLSKTFNGTVVLGTNDLSQRSKWYFEADSQLADHYYIYTIDDSNKVLYCKLGTAGNHFWNFATTEDKSEAYKCRIINRTDVNVDNKSIIVFSLAQSGYKNGIMLGWSGNNKGARFSDNLGNDQMFYVYYAPQESKFISESYTDGSFDSTVGSSMNGTSVYLQDGDATGIYTSTLSAEGILNIDKDYEVYTIRQTVITNQYGDDNWPYVTSSPKLDITSTQFLTGDGVAYDGSISYANSAIGAILTDASGQTVAKRYQVAYDHIGETITNELITKLSTYGKYSSYRKEMGANAKGNLDFPVWVVDDVLEDECTKYINEYLQYMTNTEFNFAKGDDAVFNIEIGSMKWDPGTSTFVYHSGTYNETSNPNGAFFDNNKGNEKFKIISNQYDNMDTVSGRFTLMDVQFYDPADTGSPKKIAYHLYVPILVKKMLQYDFSASTLSGTNYRVVPYDEARNNTLIENAGNPVTMEFQWKYYRTLDEWQLALESGDNLLMSLNKQLRLTLPQGMIPSGTKMVLVDPNNQNTYYYADSATTGLIVPDSSGSIYNTFDLTKFANPKGSANTFTSVDFNDFFEITVDTNAGSGGFDQVTLESDVSETKENYIQAGATVRVANSDGGYDYYKPNTSSTGTYDLTLAYKTGVYDEDTDFLTENYYITFFTDKGAPERDGLSIYHLDFSDRGTFNEPACPTSVVHNKNTHILTGDIFVNNFEIDETPGALNSNVRMTASNDSIYATLKASVGVNPILRSTVKPYLSELYTSVAVYQSMLVMLNRMEEGTQEKGILTTPVVTVSDFEISHTKNGVKTVDVEDASEKMTPVSKEKGTVTQNYIEIRDNINLRNDLYKSCDGGYNLDIQATVNLAYSSSESLSIQFPTRDSSNIDDSNIGTVIGAASNLSSTKTSAAYSKESMEDWTTTYAYYCTINTTAILTLNSDDATNVYGEYYQLGINELDMDAEESGLDLDADGNSKIKLDAVYNVSDLSAAGEAESMKIKISIRKKANYDIPLDIDDYITDLVLYDKGSNSFTDPNNPFKDYISATEPANALEYTYIVEDPDEHLVYDLASKTYQIPITFTAYSGDNFDKQFSNYMIRMDVELYKDHEATAENYIEGSRDDDHIIWTNAKIVYTVFEDQ